jgi:hypothetical protein
MRRKSSARSAITWPEAVRITRYTSLTEPQFFGCVAAFVDSLSGELNAAAIALRRLEGRSKGSAFAHEMTLDTHRYGALIVLDRWTTLTGAFGPYLQLSQHPEILEAAAERVRAAEGILEKVNRVIDEAERYSGDVVEGCVLGWQSLQMTFQEERATAEQFAKLGPMLGEDYTSARRIFLEDLAAR